jgi:RimJ/RimL family protein N-acetyltransferase
VSNEVQLVNVIESDLPIFFEQQLDPEATRMAAFPSRERDAFMAHWRKVLSNATIATRTILYHGQPAGNIACFEQSGQRQIGYWIGREYWGEGVATQALVAFLGQIQARPLYAYVAKHNIASRRVLEKCGFKLMGEQAGYPAEHGETVDELIFKLEANESQLADQLFSILREVILQFGEVKIRLGKSQVAFWRKRAFAWTWKPGQYLRGAHAPLVLTLGLRRRRPSSRWKKIVEPKPGRFTHHLELRSPAEIDDEVRAWLREAWELAG